MKEPIARDERGQQQPARGDKELPEQDQLESPVDGISAKREDTGGDQLVGSLRIDADAKALPE